MIIFGSKFCVSGFLPSSSIVFSSWTVTLIIQTDEILGTNIRICVFHQILLKAKQYHYRPGRVERVLRKLRFPDLETTAQDGCRLSALRTGRLYPQEILLLLIYIRD
jgi:hypothetical protein